MSIVFEQRETDSPFIETVTQGYTAGDGATIRPAEIHWHLVIMQRWGVVRPMIVGPWTTAGTAAWKKDAELLWIKFALGVFMPHLPTRTLLDRETVLPCATGRSFWLKGDIWQLPDYHNVEVFVERLVRQGLLVYDPVVAATLQNQQLTMSPRTLRQRFSQATGLTQSHIAQFERAHWAAALLRQGKSILDTVYEAGYFDQPHLTRSLKRFVGATPAQLCRPPEVQS